MNAKLCILVTVCVLPVAAALGQSSQPTSAPAQAASAPTGVETRPVAVPAYEDRRLGSRQDGSDTGDWLRMLAVLAMIVALIFALRWLLKRSQKLKIAWDGAGPVEVLWRTSVAPRRQVVLVRLGERLLLVGVGPGEVSRLGEVSDKAEVARLLDQLPRARRSDSVKELLQGLQGPRQDGGR